MRREERRVRKEQKKLEKYKAANDRQRLAEVRVYGHELTEKQRREFQTAQKAEQQAKMERRERLFGQIAGRPQAHSTSYRTRGRGRRSARRYAPVYQQPQFDPFTGRNVGGADLNGPSQPDLSLGGYLGTGRPQPVRRGRRNDPLNPGGMLF